jgi:cytoplasmic iron level regulating protein YaaA (DUF328/UPF0246 family)
VGIPSLAAKKARGRMGRVIIETRIGHAEDLHASDTDGFRFDPGVSDEGIGSPGRRSRLRTRRPASTRAA